MNTVTISGNLTREPESRAVGEQSVINFSIANNDDSKKLPDGSYQKIASFYDVEFWTKNPAHWLKQLVKGVPVVIEGKLKQDRWEKDGQNYSRVKISVTGYPIVAAGKSDQAAEPARQQSRAPVPPPAGPEQFEDDSIPF